MYISDNTKTVLKNFASISPSIFIESGNTLRIISKQRNVFAVYTCEENFETEFGIADLSEFLGCLSLFEKPNVDVDKGIINITGKDEEGSIEYMSCDKIIVEPAPNKTIKLDAIGTGRLDKDTVKRLMQSINILSLDTINIFSDKDNNLFIGGNNSVVKSASNKVKYKIVAEDITKPIDISIDRQLFNVLTQDYSITISDRAIGLKAVGQPLDYFITKKANVR